MHVLKLSLVLILSVSVAYGQQSKKAGTSKQEYLELRIYHAADTQQVNSIEQYLQTDFLPHLKKKGFDRIGVFKALDNDTAGDKRVYVLIPLPFLSKLEQLNSTADESIGDRGNAPAYVNASYDHAPFLRFETLFIQAFEGMPRVKPSGLTGNVNERVYELRSYESATEALHQNKVSMFNSGEIDLFERLGFNAVFYGRVLAGSRMPNLMYLTSFANKAAREEHWKAFGNDPVWKAMSSKPEYQHNVSKIDIVFLTPTSYSKL